MITERELKSAAEISAEIGRLVHDNEMVRSDGDIVLIPHPVALRQPDENGCNWTVNHVSNSTGHASVVLRAVSEVQAKWDLRE